jgi:hypothetical protein
VNLTFIQLPSFARRWAQFGLTDEDLQALEKQLMKNPDAGAVMPGTGGLRKIRFAPPSRHAGKSGAYRVGYARFPASGGVALLVIFHKSAQPNLTGQEKAYFKRLIASLRF